MTMLQILNAYSIIQKIMEINVPFEKAYEIYFLAKQINDKREFFINEEKKIIKKYQAEIESNGKLSFKNSEDAAQFSQEHKKMLEYQINDIKKIELNFNDFKNIKISPSEILMLEGVVDFIK